MHGPNPEHENNIEYLRYALQACDGIELDVQTHNGKLYFGHDEPQQAADLELMTMDNVFCHAKDIESMITMLDMQNVHCFWHQEDTITLTNQGYVWCYPGHYPAHSKAIWLDLMDHKLPSDLSGAWAVCGDYYKYTAHR